VEAKIFQVPPSYGPGRCVDAALQLMVTWGTNCQSKILIFPTYFCTSIKMALIARVMPAVPQIRHWLSSSWQL